METAFEDWVEQRQMDVTEQLDETSPLVLAAAENGNWSMNGEDDIRWETVEGDVELRVELNDSEETLEDGTKVRRQTVTRHRVCPVSDVLTINNLVTERRRGTDRLLDVSIEEDILLLPPGVDDPDLSDDLQTITDVQEVEEFLEDGTPVYRRITTTTVVPAVRDILPLSEPADHSTGLEFELSAEHVDRFEQRELERITTVEQSEPAEEMESFDRLREPEETEPDVHRSVGPTDVTDMEIDIEKRAQQVVAETLEAALEEVRSTSPGWFMGLVLCY